MRRTSPNRAPLAFGDEPMSAEQCEALRDHVEPTAAAGDADWSGGALYVYVIPVDTTVGGTHISAGIYLRQVVDATTGAWPVLSGDVDAYLDAIEAEYLEDTDQ
jgi:hypothetical protein